MSVEAFAKWASIGRTKAWDEIRLGRLRAVKAGARTLVKFDDAQSWLASLQAARQTSRPMRPAA
jgi:hypothetical protein